MLGRAHLRTVTIRGFPDQTWPGLLDELNRLPVAYRWVARWLPLDKHQAQAEITRKRRHWWAKRKGIAALLRETLYGKETQLVDSDAENQAMDADAALQELGADHVDELGLLAVERLAQWRGETFLRLAHQCRRLRVISAWAWCLSKGSQRATQR